MVNLTSSGMHVLSTTCVYRPQGRNSAGADIKAHLFHPPTVFEDNCKSARNEEVCWPT